jgi:uncharacterized protein (TIGR03083 family)
MTSELVGGVALREAAGRTAALLRTVHDPSLEVPGLTWNVGETAAHIVAEVELYTGFITGERQAGGHLDDDAAEAITPSQVSVTANALQLAEFTERDPARLADRVVPAVDAFIAAAAEHPAGDPVVAANGVAMTMPTMTAALLGEQLIHGLDIARAAKMPWRITREDALLVIAGVMAMVPDYIDRVEAAGRHIRYELRLRGGPRYRLAIDDGKATLGEPDGADGPDGPDGPDGAVDCRIVADPVAFLLVGYGRTGQIGQILRGKIIAIGRKPWLGFSFGKLITGP